MLQPHLLEKRNKDIIIVQPVGKSKSRKGRASSAGKQMRSKFRMREVDPCTLLFRCCPSTPGWDQCLELNEMSTNFGLQFSLNKFISSILETSNKVNNTKLNK